MATIAYVCAVSLIVHPAVVWGLGSSLGVSTEQFRSLKLPRHVGVEHNQGVQVAIAGVEYVGTAQTVFLLHGVDRV